MVSLSHTSLERCFPFSCYECNVFSCLLNMAQPVLALLGPFTDRNEMYSNLFMYFN